MHKRLHFLQHIVNKKKAELYVVVPSFEDGIDSGDGGNGPAVTL